MNISFPVPEGLELPDDAQEGSTFDLVANCKLEGGNLVIEAIEGVPLSKEDSEEPEDDSAAPGKKSFLESVEEQMNPAS